MTEQFQLDFDKIVKISTISKLCLSPIILSFSLWAGVTFKQPVPKSTSTYSSKIIGISLSDIGTNTLWFFRWEYLLSSGLIAIAVSPKIVSGLVVATVIDSFDPIIL